jgi:Icc-related predicted phosphoesterase
MIIDCISDLHGEYPDLEGGDLLIVAGDLTGRDLENEYALFDYWLNEQPYKKKIVIGGNHDNYLYECRKLGVKPLFHRFFSAEYLCDSGTEFEIEEEIEEHHWTGKLITQKRKRSFKIWGSPWTAAFPGMNPHCMAFTVSFGCDTDQILDEYWQMIPDDTDILITHSPPYMILDEVERKIKNGIRFENVGSPSLRATIERIKPKLHVFGHIHGQGGKQLILKHEGPNTICVNASVLNESYIQVNNPVRIIL